MSKKNKKTSNASRNESGSGCYSFIIPKTEEQLNALKTIDSNTISFLYGVPGTGKTTLAVGYALKELVNHKISKIIITRPYVSAGENLGYLPGGLEEKFDPFFTPVRMCMEKILGKSQLNKYLNLGSILVLPVAYMRGVTFENCCVIMDEAQNSSIEQMHLVLTRVGKKCKLIITGDEFQTDIRTKKNGLSDALNRLKSIDNIGFFELSAASCQRDQLVGLIDVKYKGLLDKN
jgi:phosphate starvation-inducible PhoH-like protein